MVSFYLDGGSNMTGIRNYGNPLPNPDALEEFRVETSNFSAQYGRMSSAVAKRASRSGVNERSTTATSPPCTISQNQVISSARTQGIGGVIAGFATILRERRWA